MKYFFGILIIVLWASCTSSREEMRAQDVAQKSNEPTSSAQEEMIQPEYQLCEFLAEWNADSTLKLTRKTCSLRPGTIKIKTDKPHPGQILLGDIGNSMCPGRLIIHPLEQHVEGPINDQGQLGYAVIKSDAQTIKVALPKECPENLKWQGADGEIHAIFGS